MPLQFRNPEVPTWQTGVPRLESENLILDDLNESDAKAIFAFASHDQIAKTSIWDAHKDIGESTKYIQQVRDRICFKKGETFVAWAVREKVTRQVIGTITLTELGDIRAQIGFVFHYDHWRSHVPAEALQLVLNWIFSSFSEIERLQARCFPNNVAATALLESLGMNFEGINHAMVKVRGEVRDLSCYAMTRQHWNCVSNKPGGWQVQFHQGGTYI